MTTFAQRLHERGPKFRDLNAKIKELQWVDSQFRQAGIEKDRLSKVVARRQAELEQLKKITRKEYEDTRKIKRMSLKGMKASMTGKKKELIAKEELEYHQAFERERDCTLQLEKETNELNQATSIVGVKKQDLFSFTGTVTDLLPCQKRDRTKESKDEIERMRNELDQLYEQVFQGFHAQFRTEEKLAKDYKEQNAQFQLAARDLQRFKRCKGDLEKAQSLLARCIQDVMLALDYNTYDMFSRGPMADMMEYQALNQAKARSYAVQRYMDSARTHVPEIPHPGSLNVVQGNLLLNMMFDNIMMDMIMQAQIQQTYSMLTVTATNLARGTEWVRQYIRYIEGCHRNLGQVVTITKRNLDDERFRICSEGLEGTLEDTDRGMLPDEPPPIYEPPTDVMDPPAAPPPNPDMDHLDLPHTEFDGSSVGSISPRLSPRAPSPAFDAEPTSSEPAPSYSTSNPNNPFAHPNDNRS